MLSAVVIMITRWRSARDGASRPTMPVPGGRRRARVLAWLREWHGGGRPCRDRGAVSSPGPRASAADARLAGVGWRVPAYGPPDPTCQKGPVP